MAEIKNPKKYYYAMRNKYVRTTKQIGHKLALAMSEEEDAQLWEKYKKVLTQWHALENRGEEGGREDFALQSRKFWRPVFNEEYIEMTRQINELYGQRAGMNPCERRDRIDAEIEQLKEKRKRVTTYIDRETGEEMRWR